jgi:predicted RNA-binding Zn ribbon-like protein
MEEVTSSAAELPLRGNDLALDFLNTVRDVRTGRGELVPSPVDLAVWAHHASALTSSEFDAMVVAIERDNRHAVFHYHRALRLRASITRLVTGRVFEGDLVLLDRHRRQAATSQVLAPRSGGGYDLVWTLDIDLDLVAARVAEAFVDLASSDRWGLIRQCSGPRCGWLYVDQSPGRRRRWCSMQDCGNRAKVRSFRARQSRAG